MGLRSKIILIPVVILLLAVGANVVAVSKRFRADYARTMHASMQATAGNLKLQIERLFELGFKLSDISGFDEQCSEELQRRSELSYACIVDVHGKVLFKAQRQGLDLHWEWPAVRGDSDSQLRIVHDSNGVEHYTAAAAIMDHFGKTVAWSVVASPRDHLDGPIRRLQAWAVGVAFGSAAITIVLLWSALSTMVTRPLSKLVWAIREIHSSGDLNRDVPDSSRDELGELARSFNGMIDGIRTRDAQILQNMQSLQRAHDELENRVHQRTADLTRANADLQQQIVLRKDAELRREQLHTELVEASRKAGMADVATGVLHNVGNVLNSVNVSAQLIDENLRTSHFSNLLMLSEMISQQKDPCGFIAADERGRKVPEFICKLSQALDGERNQMARELHELAANVEHIKQIVNMQQTLARTAGVTSEFMLSELIEDAIRINQAGLRRHGVALVRDFSQNVLITTDRHKALQVLINLISNAKYALTHSSGPQKLLTIRTSRGSEEEVEVHVSDNGAGIAPEHMERLFTFGFTTKKGGHGFGLHSSALAAREIGGSIAAASDGLGRGASFVFRIPVNRGGVKACPAKTDNSNDVSL